MTPPPTTTTRARSGMVLLMRGRSDRAWGGCRVDYAAGPPHDEARPGVEGAPRPAGHSGYPSGVGRGVAGQLRAGRVVGEDRGLDLRHGGGRRHAGERRDVE